MPHLIRTTWGTQYAESDQPPASCTICEEPRQYGKKTGQQWTTLESSGPLGRRGRTAGIK
jgi:hypothetical protein